MLSSTNVPVDTALKILRDTHQKINQDWQALVLALHALLQQMVARVPDMFPPFRSPFDDPYTLIRYWTPNSHAPYVDELGFVCSGWTSCSPLAQRSVLDEEPAFQPEHLRDHCQMHIKPTYWISFTDDVSWLLEHYGGNSGFVSVVSIPKLDRLNIFWCRSDFLVECYTTCGRYSEKRNPCGIKFAYSKHYLVHGWVPTECIIATYSQNQFRDICRRKDIRGGETSHKLKFQEREDKLTFMLGGILFTPPHALLQNGDNVFEDEHSFLASGLEMMHLHPGSTQRDGS